MPTPILAIVDIEVEEKAGEMWSSLLSLALDPLIIMTQKDKFAS